MKGDCTTVELLLNNEEEYLNVNLIDKDGYSALGIALRDEKYKMAYMILDQIKYPIDVNTGGGQFSSLMHLAVSKLDVKSVIKLLMRGASVSKKESQGSGD